METLFEMLSQYSLMTYRNSLMASGNSLMKNEQAMFAAPHKTYAEQQIF